MKKLLQKLRLIQQQSLQLKLSRTADNILITNPEMKVSGFFLRQCEERSNLCYKILVDCYL